ncbi:M48 family metallopeptidase [Pirellulaceae bacterium SH467]
MVTRIQLGTIEAEVTFKAIKNVHLSVHPPHGLVRISAPTRMKLDTVRVFAISKLPWIKQQQRRLSEQERETPREFIERESHFIWGKRTLLTVLEREESPSVLVQANKMRLTVRPGTNRDQRESILDKWYRDQVRLVVPEFLERWEKRMDVKVERVFVQRMRTRWGSCNPATCSIRLNTDLAKKPRQCLEYIVVHEMVHLLEPTHNARFQSLMDRYMPQWHEYRNLLNCLPVRHEDWDY